MKKVLAALILCLVIVFASFADSLVYVYGSSISSNDFEAMPRRGQVFKDGNSNLVIVKEVRDDVVLFDKFISKAEYIRGSELVKRGPLNSLNIIGSLGYSMVQYSITTPIYPFSPIAMAGASYGDTFGKSVLAMAGLNVIVPLARLWDTGFALVQNGKIVGWGAAGVSAASSVTFACGYGFSYRHYIGPFNWEVGATWLSVLGTASSVSPYIGVGLVL